MSKKMPYPTSPSSGGTVTLEMRDLGTDGQFPARVRRIIDLAKTIGLMEGKVTGWRNQCVPPPRSGESEAIKQLRVTMDTNRRRDLRERTLQLLAQDISYADALKIAMDEIDEFDNCKPSINVASIRAAQLKK